MKIFKKITRYLIILLLSAFIIMSGIMLVLMIVNPRMADSIINPYRMVSLLSAASVLFIMIDSVVSQNERPKD